MESPTPVSAHARPPLQAGGATARPGGRCTDGDPGLAPGIARCEVRASGCATRYVRAGAGGPLLLLGLPPTGGLHPLARALAVATRIVAPERWSRGDAPPESRPPLPLGAWLGPFLDGLGISRVPLVVTGEMAIPAFVFALLEPVRVERLVVLLDGPPDAAFPAEGLVERLQPSGVPLLLLASPDGEEASDTCRAILGFLAGGRDLEGSAGAVL